MLLKLGTSDGIASCFKKNAIDRPVNLNCIMLFMFYAES